MKALIAYDGTVQGKMALMYGLEKVKKEGGRATVVNIFNDTLFIGYGAGPNAESRARAEAEAKFAEARQMVKDSGVPWVQVVSEDGDPETILLHYADEGNVNTLLVPSRYKSLMKNSPYPVILFPGAILVPVDNTETSRDAIEEITAEAVATGSEVVLMGILPVHMYAPSEKADVKQLEKETLAAMRGLSKTLAAKGLRTREVMRPGYPDEEITKAMKEFGTSMVIIPTAENEPSELAKAAAIVMDENVGVRPLMVFTAACANC